MTLEGLAEGWEVWHEETTKVVLAYRPDVFDADAFPAPCLPTIYATKGERDRRPGRPDPDPDDPWYVTFYLEPDVTQGTEKHETRADALEGARETARRFAAGEIAYRDLYQVPREAYFERLDELTGRASGDGTAAGQSESESESESGSRSGSGD
jgi:hypothetical protein